MFLNLFSPYIPQDSTKLNQRCVPQLILYCWAILEKLSRENNSTPVREYITFVLKQKKPTSILEKNPCQFLWMQFFFLPQTKKKHSKNSNIMKYYYNLWYLKKMCAFKWLIAINRIQNIFFFLHNTCVCTVYIYYVYINTQRFMYIFKKNMLLLYIKYIYIRYNLYEYKYTCTYFQKICCMCVSL